MPGAPGSAGKNVLAKGSKESLQTTKIALKNLQDGMSAPGHAKNLDKMINDVDKLLDPIPIKEIINPVGSGMKFVFKYTENWGGKVDTTSDKAFAKDIKNNDAVDQSFKMDTIYVE